MELDEDPEVKTAAYLFNKLNYGNKNNLMAGLIVAGWDRHSRGTVWTIPLGETIASPGHPEPSPGPPEPPGYIEHNP